MKRLEVLGVRVEMPSKQPLVLLKEAEGQRFLPIWIGPVEATAIAIAQQQMETARPQTHALLVSVIESLGDELRSVDIVDVRDGVYFARLNFASGASVDARPSDSLAIALRVGAEIRATDEVLDSAGVVEEKDPQEQDAEVERFREFLDAVDPEDFEDH